MRPNPSGVISHQLASVLYRMNPWWEGKETPAHPETRRHLVYEIHKRMGYRLAPILVVKGTRQVGKTTACLQVISDLRNKRQTPDVFSGSSFMI